DAERCRLRVTEQLVHPVKLAEQVFTRPEEPVLRQRHRRDASQHRTREPRGATLDRKDALEPPASGLGQREQAHGLAGRRRIDDDDVIASAIDVIDDLEQARDLVETRNERHLFSPYVVEAAPLEDLREILLDRTP